MRTDFLAGFYMAVILYQWLIPYIQRRLNDRNNISDE